MDRSDSYLEMASFEKLKYTVEIHKLNLEMGEHLCSSLQWIIHFCKKYDIPLPDMNKIENIITKVREIEESKPHILIINRQVTERRSTDNETEPNFTIVLYYALRKSRYNGIRLCCFTSSQATKRS
ncbi:MAG: hypothetical protein WD717_07045 [Nitrosarchaeum sp.]